MTTPIDTKEKIIHVARILFAEKGFEGASVREIAKAAEVNVASVNYHFESKENLFFSILSTGHQECSEGIRNFYVENNPTVEELMIHVYRYFSNKSHDLSSFFKMMMSSQHSQKFSPCSMNKGSEDESFGPPGGKVISEAIAKEIGKEANDEDYHWAVRTLFSHVIHTILITTCCMRNQDNTPFSTEEDIEKGIRRLTKVVLQELRTSSI